MPRRKFIPSLVTAPEPAPSSAIGSKLQYAVREFCSLNGISRSTMYSEIAAGSLVAHKLRGRLVIFHDDMTLWRRRMPIVVLHRAQPAQYKKRETVAA